MLELFNLLLSQKYYESFYNARFYVLLLPYIILYKEKCIVAQTLQDFPQKCIDIASLCKKQEGHPQNFPPNVATKLNMEPSLGSERMSGVTQVPSDKYRHLLPGFKRLLRMSEKTAILYLKLLICVLLKMEKFWILLQAQSHCLLDV